MTNEQLMSIKEVRWPSGKSMSDIRSKGETEGIFALVAIGIGTTAGRRKLEIFGNLIRKNHIRSRQVLFVCHKPN